MCCDAGYETKDNKTDVAINAWGKKLTELVHTKLLTPNSKHGIFLDSCLHHCGGWGSYEINGMVQAPAFQKWYDGGKGINIQGKPYPCASCCTPGRQGSNENV